MTTEKRKNERTEHARAKSNAGNATIVGSIPQEKLAEAGSRRVIKGGNTSQKVSAPAIKANVRESSPIISLAMQNQQLADSVNLFADALRKVGIFHSGLVSDTLYEDMEAQLTNLRDLHGQYGASDESAISAIRYANETLFRTCYILSMFVNGNDESESKCCDGADRTEYAADRILIGRSVANVYDSFNANFSRCRSDLDNISWAIFGHEMETEIASGATSDTGIVGISYMLDVALRKTENMQNTIAALTYRINETF